VNCTCYPEYKDGVGFDRFIAEDFGECLYSGREIASFYVGMSSLVFWIACQLPQFKKNYQKKSASALSKWFLLEWFLGDALNLCGALLTHQLTTQIATATLFIINDSLMIMQMAYYGFFYRPTQANDQDLRERLVLQHVAMAAVVVPVAAFVANNKLGTPTDNAFVTLGNFAYVNDEIPSCEKASSGDNGMQDVGVIIGWVSALVYLNSRIPQILKNQKRKSVEGLSFLMFFCAVMGNTTYGLGVLLRDSSWKAIHKALPWLVGSLGTLLLDFTILLQFWYYSEDEDDEDEFTSASGTGGTATREAILRSLQRSPARGIFGIRAWNTSPFFKPLRAAGTPPPLDLRDTTSLGVLPSEERLEQYQPVRRYTDDGLDTIRERAGSVG